VPVLFPAVPYPLAALDAAAQSATRPPGMSEVEQSEQDGTASELDGMRSELDRGRSRRRRAVIVFAVLLLLLLAAFVVAAAMRPRGPLTLPLPPGITAGPAPSERVGSGPQPTARPGSGAAPSAGSGPSTPAGATAGPGAPLSAAPTSAPAAPVPLTARYANEGGTGLLGLAGYTGRVTISNSGPVAVSGWSVTISVPNGTRVSRPSGATMTLSGNTATFTPVLETRTVSSDTSVSFTFVGEGLLAGQPTGCAIDGNPCG
jgi:hypothetical protein